MRASFFGSRRTSTRTPPRSTPRRAALRGGLWYTVGVMAIERTVVCALIALMATLFTWLGGGVVGPWLTPWTPWLTLLLAEAMLVLPEQRAGETLFDARRRVCGRYWPPLGRRVSVGE